MPLILMLGSLFLAHVGLMQSELHLVVVMLLSLTVTMFVEFFRKHNLRETMDDVQAFFDGMGTQFANVVSWWSRVKYCERLNDDWHCRCGYQGAELLVWAVLA